MLRNETGQARRKEQLGGLPASPPNTHSKVRLRVSSYRWPPLGPSGFVAFSITVRQTRLCSGVRVKNVSGGGGGGVERGAQPAGRSRWTDGQWKRRIWGDSAGTPGKVFLGRHLSLILKANVIRNRSTINLTFSSVFQAQKIRQG